MRYSKELHERILQRIRDQGEVISFGTPFVECLLEEISRLQAENKQYQNIFDIQKMTIERLQAERRWIPVSERLPVIHDDYDGEKSDCCYVRDIHRCVWIAYYRPDEKDWYVLPTGIILTAVTHWMPLPPQEELK